MTVASFVADVAPRIGKIINGHRALKVSSATKCMHLS